MLESAGSRAGRLESFGCFEQVSCGRTLGNASFQYQRVPPSTAGRPLTPMIKAIFNLGPLRLPLPWRLLSKPLGKGTPLHYASLTYRQ